MRIETERLILRAPVASDVPELLSFRNSEYVLKFNPMKKLDPEEYQREVEQDALSGRTLYIELKSEGRAIGIVSMESDELRFGVDSVMLSYWLGEAYSGKAYMTEALQAVIKELFSQGKSLISARVFEPNTASRRLLEKLGFIQEGRLRMAVNCRGIIYDDCIYSLINTGKLISAEGSF